MNKLPYVISEELDLNIRNTQSVINTDKLDAFRENLDTDLRNMGKQPYWVPSSTITAGLNRITQQTQLPVVSLDDRYLTAADQYLGISRGTDSNLNDDGYAARYNYPPIDKQLEQIAALGSEIMLADDVLFSGEMIAWLSERLARTGVKIGAVAVGIAMQEGITKLAAQGIDVNAAIVFDDVEDELCERDLAVVPGSGRRVASAGANALYFDVDNGKPEQWASISTDTAAAFCANSLQRSMKLLQPSIPMSSVGRFIGYGTEGTAVATLSKRLNELS